MAGGEIEMLRALGLNVGDDRVIRPPDAGREQPLPSLAEQLTRLRALVASVEAAAGQRFERGDPVVLDPQLRPAAPRTSAPQLIFWRYLDLDRWADRALVRGVMRSDNVEVLDCLVAYVRLATSEIVFTPIPSAFLRRVGGPNR